jgi:hypothetical protein
MNCGENLSQSNYVSSMFAGQQTAFLYVKQQVGTVVLVSTLSMPSFTPSGAGQHLAAGQQPYC